MSPIVSHSLRLDSVADVSGMTRVSNKSNEAHHGIGAPRKQRKVRSHQVYRLPYHPFRDFHLNRNSIVVWRHLVSVERISCKGQPLRGSTKERKGGATLRPLPLQLYTDNQAVFQANHQLLTCRAAPNFRTQSKSGIQG